MSDHGLTKSGTLKHGLKVGTAVHKEFVLRELKTADMFAAEAQADAEKTISYSAALLCKQLLSIGDFKGPFSLDVIGKLKPVDFARLRQAQRELEDEGEGGQLG